jgi:hypothetical protein
MAVMGENPVLRVSIAFADARFSPERARQAAKPGSGAAKSKDTGTVAASQRETRHMQARKDDP